ncbi:hypothetical protein BH20ACI4_BH20ACI4_17580 [soil metagenome]
MQNRREFLQLLIAGAGASIVLPNMSFGQTVSADAWKTEYPKILARIKPPKFKKKDYLITKYGAVADGKTLATDAIKKAIEDCSKKGGGTYSLSIKDSPAHEGRRFLAQKYLSVANVA